MKNGEKRRPKQWRGLEDLDGRTASLPDSHNEFPPGAAEPPVPPADLISRRRFLALTGATAALAATAACSRADRGTIVPYTRRPEDALPGEALAYASTFQEGLRAYPVLVKTREGRPIHVEGNDRHPAVLGKTSPRTIADVLRLYDPDRLRHPIVDGNAATWEAALARIAPALKGAAAARRQVLLLSGAVTSPTTRALLEEVKQKLPGLQHLQWEAASSGAEARALLSCYGENLSIRPRPDRARVIVSFENDFLNGEDPESVRGFAEWRRPDGPRGAMSRLWAFEGGFSLTGSKADHRVQLRPSRASVAAFALAELLVAHHGLKLPPGIDSAVLSNFEASAGASAAGVPVGMLHAVAADLAGAGREALVLAGPDLPPDAHAACHLLNAMLGALGNTLENAGPQSSPGLASLLEIERIAETMASGGFAAAMIWGANPAYALPDARAWDAALAKVPLRVRMGLFEDETARACQVVLPESHWLESWGDFEESPALLCLQQPAVRRLYDTRQGEELLLDLLRTLGGAAPADYPSFLKSRWQREVYPAGSAVSFEAYWSSAVHEGFVSRQVPPRPRPEIIPDAVAEAARAARRRMDEGPAKEPELVLRPDAKLFDGRYANSGWLQELPDPVTKLTWGNALGLSVAEAAALRLSDGDVVHVEAGGRSAEVPVLVQPGQAPGVLTLALGWGRAAGSVAAGIGANAFPLVDAKSEAPFIRDGVHLRSAGKRVTLATTQTHFRMEGRDLARSWSLAEYDRREKAPREKDLTTLYAEQKFPVHKWGMAIDLSACVGCAGCVVACQSENNIPVVGPEQVARSRSMHWIRVDRYYEGPPEDPKSLSQVMLCQQCDDAPCENVCPVNATTHSSEGLNQMVYNRCVGTRYCANNCPYKVRRFNYYEFNAGKKPPEILVFNPEVSVRPRGVMEKCTFCIQRIEDAKMRAKVEGRSVRDGEIVPACAAACPAEAIVFGDLDDPESRASKLAGSGRGYKVLEELGVRPAVTYLAEIKNPKEEP